MSSVIAALEAKQKKHQVVDVRSGDSVRVHQKIKEGTKERVQIFEGLVIRTDRKNSLSSIITVRRVASGIGVEKTYLLHSPLVVKIEVIKRSKVRRNYLSYMRKRSGKSARLTGSVFDKEAVNTIEDAPVVEEAVIVATNEPVDVEAKE
ncbi:50S ribosomal protein L19 [Candidatus Saccharibacteria bacterium]|nr:50S ribosomal protein L19 [Candidatus Saccharibacteria bacterium]